MEFDQNTNNTISDEARRKAETKQVTLQPIHGDVSPDDVPASEVAAQHLNAGPIANSPNDTEETARKRQAAATASTASSEKRFNGSAALIGIVMTGSLVTVFLLYLFS